MKAIQMIPTSKDNSIFILDFDVNTNELTFRTTRNSENIQKEIVRFDEKIVYTNLYNFSIDYLQKFLYENNKEE